MKLTSLIFLVLSIILFVGGYFTCKIAKSMAADAGVSLYDTKKDDAGDFVFHRELNEDDLTKLSLNFGNVDITIIGGAPNSYIEIKNFSSEKLRSVRSGNSVSFDGMAGFLSSLIDQSNGGIQFKGLRYFLQDQPTKDMPQSVTLYLADGTALTNLSVSLMGGNLSIKNIRSETDFHIVLNEGSLSAENICSHSMLEANVMNGNIVARGVSLETFLADIDDGNITLKANGKYDPMNASYQLTASGDGKTVTYNGLVQPEPSYKSSAASAENTFRFTVKNGNITVDDQ